MRLEIFIEAEERIDNLAIASAIIGFCEADKEFKNGIDAVKVAKAILLEMVGEE